MEDTLFTFQKKYIQKINQEVMKNKILVVSGNSGMGKTFVCNKFLEFRNDCYAVRCHFNNLSFSDNNHTELKIALYKSLPEMKKGIDSKNISSEVSKLAQDLPILKNITSRLIDSLFNKRLNKLQNDSLKTFNNNEIEIINLFCRITDKKRLILILDNIHWANDNTLTFLHNLTRLSANSHFFTNPFYIIFISTTDQEKTEEHNVDSPLFPLQRMRVEDISLEHYREVLNRFHPKIQFSEKTILFLYSITRGHLEINKSLLRHVCKQNLEEAIENYREKGDDKEKLLKLFFSLFDNIALQHLADKKGTVTTLEVASVIGNIFNKYELSKLLNIQNALLEDQLLEACQNQLTINEKEIARFTHPIIQELFLQKLNVRKYEWHIKYAECLKVIRPTQLILRGLHYEAGSQELKALLSYVLAYFECLRKKTDFPVSIYNYIINKSNLYKIDKCFGDIKEAILNFIMQEPQKAIAILNGIDELDIFHKVLRHYKNLLYTRCLLETSYDTKKIEEIVETLKNAQAYFLKHQEIELAIHTILLLINLYADKLNLFSQAKELEKDFFDIYEQYLLDPEMQRYYYEYRRKSITLCSPEMGLKRLEDCLSHYKEDPFTDPVEFYRCICNYVGLLIFSGEYEKAVEEIKENETFLIDEISLSFPEPHKLLNNYILGQYLDSLSKKDKSQLWQAITDYEKLYGIRENKIISINLANLYILAGQQEKGEEILMRQKEEIETVNKDVFYHLHIYSNLCSLCYIRQEYQQARYYLELAYRRIDEFSPNIQAFYKARGNYFFQLLDEKPVLTAEELLFYFIHKTPYVLGKSWRFVGLGFLFSDLQFYTS